MANATKGKRQGFPEAYSGLTPLRKLVWLRGAECKAFIVARRLMQSQVEAEIKRIEKDGARVARTCPSPNRLDEYQSGYPFPPPAPHSPMVKPAIVFLPNEFEQYHPPQHLNIHGATYDVIVYNTERRRTGLNGTRMGSGGTSSPATVAREELERVGGVLVQLKLMTEDEGTLREQIERFKQGRRTSLFDT